MHVSTTEKTTMLFDYSSVTNDTTLLEQFPEQSSSSVDVSVLPPMSHACVHLFIYVTWGIITCERIPNAVTNVCWRSLIISKHLEKCDVFVSCRPAPRHRRSTSWRLPLPLGSFISSCANTMLFCIVAIGDGDLWSPWGTLIRCSQLFSFTQHWDFEDGGKREREREQANSFHVGKKSLRECPTSFAKNGEKKRASTVIACVVWCMFCLTIHT